MSKENSGSNNLIKSVDNSKELADSNAIKMKDHSNLVASMFMSTNKTGLMQRMASPTAQV